MGRRAGARDLPSHATGNSNRLDRVSTLRAFASSRASVAGTLLRTSAHAGTCASLTHGSTRPGLTRARTERARCGGRRQIYRRTRDLRAVHCCLNTRSSRALCGVSASRSTTRWSPPSRLRSDDQFSPDSDLLVAAGIANARPWFANRVGFRERCKSGRYSGCRRGRFVRNGRVSGEGQPLPLVVGLRTTLFDGLGVVEHRAAQQHSGGDSSRATCKMAAAMAAGSA